ncbi:MAG TPA: 30S ribosomal protein S20 [Candidatus Dormibacteraeota bacterium]
MAKRTASARKQARAGARRAIRNRGARSEVKTLIVKARRSLTDTQAEASERTDSTVEAVRALDRAAAKKILHPNNAARRKSRLARQLAKLAAAAPAPPAKGKKAAPAPAPKKK